MRSWFRSASAARNANRGAEGVAREHGGTTPELQRVVTVRPDLHALASDEQAQFVDLVRDLTAEEWEAPTLCTGLSVRDVVVHVAAHIHGEPDTPEVVYAIIRSGFSPGRAGRILDQNQRARHSWISPAILEVWLASPISASSDPSMETQLSEMVIHQQDIRRAISRPRSIPWDAVAEVLGFSTSRAGFVSVNQARWRLRGLRVEATDGPWSQGTGAAVMGPGEALIMAVNGRPEALADLSGPQVCRS